MTPALDSIAWPPSEARTLVDELLERSRLAVRAAPDRGHWDSADVGATLKPYALVRGASAEQVDVTFGALEDFLTGSAPAILHSEHTRPPVMVGILRRRGRKIDLVTPSGKVVTLPARQVATLLQRSADEPAEDARKFAEQLGLTGPIGERVAIAVMQDRRAGKAFGSAWVLRAAASESLGHQLTSIGAPRTIALLFLVSLLSALVLMGAFLMFGSQVLKGRGEPSQVWPWALLILTAIPLQFLSMWLQSSLLLEVGALVKRRLLEGALRISSDRMRHAGIGTFLGKVNESEALEQASFASAFGLFEGFASLAISSAVLSVGPAPGAHVGLLLIWTVAIAIVGVYRLQATRRWSQARVEMSNDLVEKICGHRTRVIQQLPSHWHDGEDPALYEYHRYTQSLDAATTVLRLAPRAWMLTGFLVLFPVLLGSVDALELTIGIAGLILAAQAMMKVSQASLMVNRLVVAWREISELYKAGYAPMLKLPEHVARPVESKQGTVLDLSDVRVTYPRSGRAALQGCTGRVADGDRILLQGPSGGGKSTLASVITGLRRVDGGVALLEGLDVHTLDASYWRRIVAGAPQFHENHVFNATLGFNVLLGRGWPPKAKDLKEAREVLEDLGLGPLLDRMPLGLAQMVGAQGWQLSHGERSRVFVARALLQRSRLIILDESFGALDPHTLVQCMQTVLNRSRTLLVIAHP